jgi:DNA-binding NarL/FixJ family response regulator
MLQTNAYDVAILDWNMPELDGIEIAKKVRKKKLKTKIIIISGYMDDKLTVEFILSGVSAYISKLLEPSDLSKIVREVSKGLYFLPMAEMIENKTGPGSSWVTKDEAVDWAEKELLAQKKRKAKWEALKDAYANWKKTNSGRR